MSATFIQIQYNNHPLLIGAVYYSPNKKFLISELDSITQISNNFIIGGDLNAKNVEWNSRITTARGRILAKHSDLHGYQVLAPIKPTFFSYNSNILPDVLDIFLYNCNAIPLSIDTLEELSSDHNPVLLLLEGAVTKLLLPAVFSSSIDWSTYRSYISQSISGNPQIKTKEDVDIGIKLLETTIKDAKHAALQQNPIQNFFRQDLILRKLRGLKCNARKQWQKTRAQRDKNIFNFLKNRVHKLALEIKINKFEKDITDATENNTIWSITKRLTKSQTSFRNKPLKGRNGLIFDPIEKAEMIADSFEKSV